MTLEIIATYAIGICLLIGAFFMLVASVGLLRFDNAMTRLHGPTKAGTLGVGALLLGSMVHSDVLGEGWSFHELLIMAFLFVTAPISANFLAKVAMHSGACETPPSPSSGETWSTLMPPEEKRDETDPKQP